MTIKQDIGCVETSEKTENIKAPCIKVNEGECTFLTYPGEIKKKDSVFYNPLMKFNRDISVLALSEFIKMKKTSRKKQEKEYIFSAADVFCASGIRGIRYAKECENIGFVYLNDLNPTAIDTAKRNAELNNVKSLDICLEDANAFLSKHKNSIDFIDIDPFGSPSQFIDSAARASSKKSMIAVTATDTAPLSGTYPNACFRKYAAWPLRFDIKHETGIRILIGYIALVFARYEKAFRPVLSFSDIHYFRIFGISEKGKSKADSALKNIGFCAYCKKCGFRSLFARNEKIVKCPSCGSDIDTGGPLWTGNMSDSDFIINIINSCKCGRKTGTPDENKDQNNICGFLEKLSEESRINYLFYDIHDFCKKNKLDIPKNEEITNALKSAGFKVSGTHFSPTGIRTDADSNAFRKCIKSIKKDTFIA